MDPNNLPPLDSANDITAVGSRKPSDRARFKHGLLGIAMLGALATGAALHETHTAPVDIQQAQAQVVAKYVMHDGVALQGNEGAAWQQAQSGLQARHNLVLEHDGRLAVVSVSPQVFDSVCTHITEDLANKWDGGLGCGTQYGPGDAPPKVVIDTLDKVAVTVSPDARDSWGMVVHELQGAEPVADGFGERLKLRQDLKPKSKSFSI